MYAIRSYYVSFTPGSTDDITFNTDSDSTLVITGLTSASGTSLCLDATNNVVLCSAGSGSSPWTLANNTLYPDQYWSNDLLIGGNSTSSATFAVESTTGNVTAAGNVNVGGDASVSGSLVFYGGSSTIDVLDNSTFVITSYSIHYTKLYEIWDQQI